MPNLAVFCECYFVRLVSVKQGHFKVGGAFFDRYLFFEPK